MRKWTVRSKHLHSHHVFKQMQWTPYPACFTRPLDNLAWFYSGKVSASKLEMRCACRKSSCSQEQYIERLQSTTSLYLLLHFQSSVSQDGASRWDDWIASEVRSERWCVRGIARRDQHHILFAGGPWTGGRVSGYVMTPGVYCGVLPYRSAGILLAEGDASLVWATHETIASRFDELGNASWMMTSYTIGWEDFSEEPQKWILTSHRYCVTLPLVCLLRLEGDNLLIAQWWRSLIAVMRANIWW